MRVYSLKSGDTFTSPSLFINPQHPLDAKAIATAANHGLANIDGMVIDLLDYNEVSESLGFNTQELMSTSRSDARRKVRFIDPGLHHLLSGSDDEKEKMLATKLFDAKVDAHVRGMMNEDIMAKEKPKRIIDEVYPYLVVKPLIEFQIRNNASAIIAPCVNLSSKKYLSTQISKATRMLTDSRILLETSLKAYSETRDLINVLTISYKLAEPQNYVSLFRFALCNKPDQVAFKFLGVRESDTVAVKNMFTFLRDFAMYSMDTMDRREPIPIHLFNVDELGYSGYCSAVCNIVSPIATTPYYAFPSKDRENAEVDTSPTYYHPIDMNHPKLHSIDRLPCSCYECARFRTMSNVSKRYLPMFRRLHWLYVKDEEIRQFRESRARLDVALRDKFANSMRTQLADYIPENPLFTIY